MLPRSAKSHATMEAGGSRGHAPSTGERHETRADVDVNMAAVSVGHGAAAVMVGDQPPDHRTFSGAGTEVDGIATRVTRNAARSGDPCSGTTGGDDLHRPELPLDARQEIARRARQARARCGCACSFGGKRHPRGCGQYGKRNPHGSDPFEHDWNSRVCRGFDCDNADLPGAHTTAIHHGRLGAPRAVMGPRLSRRAPAPLDQPARPRAGVQVMQPII